MESSVLKYASTEVRKGFVTKVYGILVMQLILTIAIAVPSSKYAEQWTQEHPTYTLTALTVSLALTVGILFAMTCCPDVTRSYPQNYIMLFTFTVFESILVGFTCASYTPASVLSSLVLTAVIFLGLTMYAWTTKKDFTGMGPYLFAFLFGLFVAVSGLWFLSFCGVHIPLMNKFFAGCGVVIFTLYIVYDTQLILGELKGHKMQFDVDDYVFAALTLYLDIINLFLELLRLLGDYR